MVKALVGLLSLLALLLMPLGMDAALAAGERSVSATAAHCVDHDDGNQEVPAQPERHCAACIALTGAAAPAPQPVRYMRMLPVAWEQASSSGLKGKVITPPPRLG